MTLRKAVRARVTHAAGRRLKLRVNRQLSRARFADGVSKARFQGYHNGVRFWEKRSSRIRERCELDSSQPNREAMLCRGTAGASAHNDRRDKRNVINSRDSRAAD